MQKTLRKNRKGFTLIELIVVIAIIGILVLLATPRFINYTQDAKVAAMQADAKVLSNAVLQYNIKTEAYPVGAETTLGALTDLTDAEIAALQTATGVTGLDTLKVAPIDETEIKSYVKNTKNPISEYYVVTDPASDLFLEVFHDDGIAYDGNYHNGVYSGALN